MKKILLLFIFIFNQTQAQQNSIPVFISGQEGHKIYRIPAIISLPNGELLAFAEGRVNGGSDFGDINIVLKRSADKGKTWSSISTIVDYEHLQAGNPAPVFDNSDPAFPNGRLFLFYNTGNNHESEIRKGNGLREVCYKTSTDEGKTWSEGVNITTQVHRPKQPAVNPAYNFEEDWRHYANTPGHAIQLQNGKYKGRLYIAANHSAGEPGKQGEDYFSHGFYSDDHGKTFRLSDVVYIEGSNECTATELSGNRVMLNIRNQKGDIKARWVVVSDADAGEKWAVMYMDEKLPDPVCEGSILSLGIRKGKHILAFSNPAHETKRDNLTLRISYDEGRTWSVSKVIDKSADGNTKDYTAYSDIVTIDKKTVGVLYEKDQYSQIVFKVVDWE